MTVCFYEVDFFHVSIIFSTLIESFLYRSKVAYVLDGRCLLSQICIECLMHAHLLYVELSTNIQGVPGGMCQTSGECSLC